MPTAKMRPIKAYPFLPLFEKFITSSRSGRRLQPNGKRISEGTIRNYQSVKKLLDAFVVRKNFELRLREERRLNTRETLQEQRYWKKFYQAFTDYLY